MGIGSMCFPGVIRQVEGASLPHIIAILMSLGLKPGASTSLLHRRSGPYPERTVHNYRLEMRGS